MTKSRALWLENGDSNTKFFHRYAKHHRMVNAILDLEASDGNWIIGKSELKCAVE